LRDDDIEGYQVNFTKIPKKIGQIEVDEDLIIETCLEYGDVLTDRTQYQSISDSAVVTFETLEGLDKFKMTYDNAIGPWSEGRTDIQIFYRHTLSAKRMGDLLLDSSKVAKIFDANGQVIPRSFTFNATSNTLSIYVNSADQWVNFTLNKPLAVKSAIPYGSGVLVPLPHLASSNDPLIVKIQVTGIPANTIRTELEKILKKASIPAFLVGIAKDLRNGQAYKGFFWTMKENADKILKIAEVEGKNIWPPNKISFNIATTVRGNFDPRKFM